MYGAQSQGYPGIQYKKERQSRDHTGIWKDLAWEPQGCLGSGLVGQLCLETFSLKRLNTNFLVLFGFLWVVIPQGLSFVFEASGEEGRTKRSEGWRWEAKKESERFLLREFAGFMGGNLSPPPHSDLKGPVHL